MNGNERRIRIGHFKSRTMGTWHVAVRDDDEVFCSCAGYIYNRKCWHVDTLLAKPLDESQVVDMPAVKIDELVVKHKEYPSSLKSLNSLLSGNAYSTSEIFALYGLPNIGKTLLAVQESFWIASQGVNVLYIDTEGSLVTALKSWKQRFEQRFGRKADIYAVSYTSLEDLMRFLGYHVDISLKGNKVEVSSEMLRGTSEYEQFVKENSIGFVVLDSVSAPIRNKFPSAQQNFPARADITSMIYASLLKSQAYGVSVLTVHHATFNPANPYETHAEMRGGIVVQYYSKRIVYMDMREKKGMEDVRRLWLVRGPNSRSWSNVAFARITSQGFVDEPYSDDYLTDGEKRMLHEGLIEELAGEPYQQRQQQKKRKP
ncbi:MAG: AAA family ATPase [Thermofilaceae archaeon]